MSERAEHAVICEWCGEGCSSDGLRIKDGERVTGQLCDACSEEYRSGAVFRRVRWGPS